jgi:hypothetical protein
MAIRPYKDFYGDESNPAVREVKNTSDKAPLMPPQGFKGNTGGGGNSFTKFASGVFDDITTRPSKRTYQDPHTGIDEHVRGSGKDLPADTEFLSDWATTGGQIYSSLAKKPLTPFLEGDFIKGGPNPSWAKTGVNIGAGIVGGIASEAVGDYVGGQYEEEARQLKADLEAARYYQDDELQAKIMEAINRKYTNSANVKTFGHGVGVGFNGGTVGVAIGAGSAATVNAMREATGGIQMYMPPDKEFIREYRAKQNQDIANAFSNEGSGMNPNDALDVILERARRGYDMEVDKKGTLPDQATTDAIAAYMMSHQDDPEFMGKAERLLAYMDGSAAVGMDEERHLARIQRVSEYPSRKDLESKHFKNGKRPKQYPKPTKGFGNQ